MWVFAHSDSKPAYPFGRRVSVLRWRRGCVLHVHLPSGMIQKGTPVPFLYRGDSTIDLFNLFIDVILFPMSPGAFTLDTNTVWQFMLLILLPVGFICTTKQLVKGVF